MASLVLPTGAALRVIPDVHGHIDAFAALVEDARAQGRFVLQLGDMVDRGPDSAGALALMLDLVDEGAGMMLMGNHDWKIVRALMGRPVRLNVDAERTLAELEARPGLADRFLAARDRLPLYARHRGRLFVHGAWEPAMSQDDPLSTQDYDRVLQRALYGQTTGLRDPKGRFERVWDWVDTLPDGLEVVIGHDWRSPSVVLERAGAGGGRALLLDLGAGKGGPLAHMDIEPDGHARFSHPVAAWRGVSYEVREDA